MQNSSFVLSNFLTMIILFNSSCQSNFFFHKATINIRIIALNRCSKLYNLELGLLMFQTIQQSHIRQRSGLFISFFSFNFFLLTHIFKTFIFMIDCPAAQQRFFYFSLQKKRYLVVLSSFKASINPSLINQPFNACHAR